MSESSQSHPRPETEAQAKADAAADGNPETNSNSAPKRSIPREQQLVFGDDGDLEPDEDSVETSLEAFGAEVDHSEGSSRVAQPTASRFGVDDRAETSQRTESDQHSLFADVDDGQQTLGGADAATRCLFDNDDGDEDSDGGAKGDEHP